MQKATTWKVRSLKPVPCTACIIHGSLRDRHTSSETTMIEGDSVACQNVVCMGQENAGRYRFSGGRPSLHLGEKVHERWQIQLFFYTDRKIYISRRRRGSCAKNIARRILVCWKHLTGNVMCIAKKRKEFQKTSRRIPMHVYSWSTSLFCHSVRFIRHNFSMQRK